MLVREDGNGYREDRVFGWLKARRRAKLLAEPFPETWRTLIEKNSALYRTLSQEERGRLHDALRLFIAERDWEACGGLEMTDEVKVTVAAQACLLTLGRTVDAYDHVRTVLVYPEAYYVPVEEADEAGVVVEEEEDREGEAWEQGSVVLSWADVKGDARRCDGRNLVLHEFAHQLDMGDGAANGTPRLEDAGAEARWARVMSAEFAALRERARTRGRGVLDTYGAEDESEFFAVAAEAFFERPRDLRRQRPELYDLLRDYFRQDPAERIRR